jgi:KipI family sensor histidine kinase inhibitor
MAASPYDQPGILLLGDTALSVEFGHTIDPAINRRVQNLFLALKSKNLPGILDLNPTYRSLLVQYDPLKLSPEAIQSLIRKCLKGNEAVREDEVRIHRIPVCYGGPFGPDLEEVAHQHLLGPEEVVALHTAVTYHVYMIGFTPGFPFLGGLDQRLFTPRKKTPREKVPAGSVGIADRQTGIYSMESPGGWQLIGRTPLKLFDPALEDPILIRAGEKLEFIPIPEETYWKLSVS